MKKYEKVINILPLLITCTKIKQIIFIWNTELIKIEVLCIAKHGNEHNYNMYFNVEKDLIVINKKTRV